MESKTFSIPNISCNHCIMTIKNELSENEGLMILEGNAEKKEVKIDWESPFSEEKIREILIEINYPAE